MVLAAVPVGAQTEAHLYSPGTNLERSELVQLETATRSVDVAMYSFTDRELAEELATLARKGVRVRVYRDRDQFQQENGLWKGTSVAASTTLVTPGWSTTFPQIKKCCVLFQLPVSFKFATKNKHGEVLRLEGNWDHVADLLNAFGECIGKLWGMETWSSVKLPPGRQK